jgi:hypothetical protein
MAGRRTLIEGLKKRPKADPKKEEAFVFGDEMKRKVEAPPRTREPKEQSAPPPPSPAAGLGGLGGRVPLTTRIRPELAAALKRASLERQLAGQTPNTVQDILEQALEPWLNAQGYLKD